MTGKDCSDDELLLKLRNAFSDTPTMNQVRKELRSMRQKEDESSSMPTDGVGLW